MSVKVLGLSASPRRGGNSDVLLEAALSGAESEGAETELVALRDLRLSPCVECNACYRTGSCRIQDDYQAIFDKLLAVDHIVFSTPVFFMAVAAQGKLLIDRCQCLWSKKYELKQAIVDPARERRGLVIAVGGSKSKRMFDCIHLTMKYWFDVLDVGYAANLFVNKVDAKGDAVKHPTAVAEARRLGAAIVQNGSLGGENPTNVELFAE